MMTVSLYHVCTRVPRQASVHYYENYKEVAQSCYFFPPAIQLGFDTTEITISEDSGTVGLVIIKTGLSAIPVTVSLQLGDAGSAMCKTEAITPSLVPRLPDFFTQSKPGNEAGAPTHPSIIPLVFFPQPHLTTVE